MAIKTFTTGEVLTASDTNTYLANAGLVYVSAGTFSNAGSFDVTGFVSTYGTYRLIMNVGRHSGAGGAAILGIVGNGSSWYTNQYFGAGWRVLFNGTSGVVGARNNGADFDTVTVQQSDRLAQIAIETTGFNTTSKVWTCTGAGYDQANSGSTTFGYQQTQTTLNLTVMRFSCSTNMTGDWRLYGYREP